MAVGAQVEGWTGPSRRRVPRFPMLAPLEVTVLRSGIPDTVPGRALNVCERGIAAVLAGELTPGDSVGVELQLSATSEPLRTRATVRYHEKLRYGLEFTALSAEQRNAIRDWAKGVKAEAEPKEDSTSLVNPKEQNAKEQNEIEVGKEKVRAAAGGGPRRSKQKKSSRGWFIAYALIGIVAVVFWWKWNQSWEELESGLKSSEAASASKPQTQVAAEVMQKLLVHRVAPVYPAEARKQKLQGIIAVNIVVGRDGSVLSMRALNGPDVLAQAAMDALRWWKFEPYRINGEPAIVETTLAVEFKR